MVSSAHAVQAAYRKMYHAERYAVLRCYREIRFELMEKKLVTGMIAGNHQDRLCSGCGSDVMGEPNKNESEKIKQPKAPKGTYEKQSGTCKTCKHWDFNGGVSVCTRGPRMAANATDTCARWWGR